MDFSRRGNPVCHDTFKRFFGTVKQLLIGG
jgi:hypothetical protein